MMEDAIVGRRLESPELLERLELPPLTSILLEAKDPSGKERGRRHWQFMEPSGAGAGASVGSMMTMLRMGSLPFFSWWVTDTTLSRSGT